MLLKFVFSTLIESTFALIRFFSLISIPHIPIRENLPIYVFCASTKRWVSQRHYISQTFSRILVFHCCAIEDDCVEGMNCSLYGLKSRLK